MTVSEATSVALSELPVLPPEPADRLASHSRADWLEELTADVAATDCTDVGSDCRAAVPLVIAGSESGFKSYAEGKSAADGSSEAGGNSDAEGRSAAEGKSAADGNSSWCFSSARRANCIRYDSPAAPGVAAAARDGAVRAADTLVPAAILWLTVEARAGFFATFSAFTVRVALTGAALAADVFGAAADFAAEALVTAVLPVPVFEAVVFPAEESFFLVSAVLLLAAGVFFAAVSFFFSVFFSAAISPPRRRYSSSDSYP